MLGVQRRLCESEVLANDEIGMTSDERNLLSARDSLHCNTVRSGLRFNDLTVPRLDVAKQFAIPDLNRVALAAAGPVAVETVRDIDRSLLLSASRREQNAATRSSRKNVHR